MAMFIIAAQKTPEDQISWAVNLAVLIFQDMIVIPLMTMIILYVLNLFRNLDSVKMNKGLHAKSLQFVDRDLEDIYEGLKKGKLDSSRVISSYVEEPSSEYTGPTSRQKKNFSLLKYQKVEGSFQFL